MPDSISVTSIRVAFECPRLFYLGERFGAKTVFQPPETPKGIGKAFHDLSVAFVRLVQQEPYFRELFAPEAATLDADAIAQTMQTLFYEQVFYPYLQRAIGQNPAQSAALLQLWQGLRQLIQQGAQLLIRNRYHCSPADLFDKTFLAQESPVQCWVTLPNGSQQLVRGSFDSLVYDFEYHRLCVVEYKTYPSFDPAAQLAQVAFYSVMLKEQIGVPIDSALYRVLPDWEELSFTWEQIGPAMQELLPPRLEQMQQWLAWEPGQPDPPPPTPQTGHFCPICPQYTRCQTLFAGEAVVEVQLDEQKPTRLAKLPQSVLTEEPEPSPPTEPDVMGDRLVEILQSFGLAVQYAGEAVGPAFVRVRLKPAPGVKVSSILRLSHDLRVQLGLTYPPLIAPQAGYVSVDLPRPNRHTARFEDYVSTNQSQLHESVQIAIGVDLDGKLIEADLSDPNTCHFLIGGTTGSGKSEFLRSLLLSLIVRHSPDQLQIVLVDPKRVTFPEFEQMPWLLAPVVKEGDRAIQIMHELVDEMESRYQRFEVSGCNDLRTYNARFRDRALHRIVCIFDEYADFMAEKDTRSALELSIKRLGAMARAAGIHLIIATQRPEARVVTPLIRSNLPGRVALRTASEADSMIILGGKETAAAALLGKGDLLYQSGSALLRLQSLFAGKIKPSWFR